VLFFGTFVISLLFLIEKETRMDLGIIIAIGGSALSIIGVVLGMMFWMRSECNSMRSEQKEDRKDILSLIRSIELKMKDFHYKLIEIERSRKTPS